jgi:hypothetical protein
MTAPRFRLEYIADWRDAPMAYWTHVEQDGKAWCAAERFEPPAPAPRGRLGYALLRVEVGAHDLVFSSTAQLDEMIRVLTLVPLPPSRRLARDRAGRGTAAAPAAPPLNSHWLSRLPTALKSAKARPRTVEALRAVRALAVRDGCLVAPPAG